MSLQSAGMRNIRDLMFSYLQTYHQSFARHDTQTNAVFLDRDCVFQVQWLNTSSHFEICLVKLTYRLTQSFKVLWKAISFPPAKVTQCFTSPCTDALILLKLRLMCIILLELTV